EPMSTVELLQAELERLETKLIEAERKWEKVAHVLRSSTRLTETPLMLQTKIKDIKKLVEREREREREREQNRTSHEGLNSANPRENHPPNPTTTTKISFLEGSSEMGNVIGKFGLWDFLD